MPKHADLSKALSRASNTRAAELVLSKQQVQNALLELDKIRDRPGGDTRPLNQSHIKELVQSIAVIGLISPLTVDRQYQLLAGAHRKAALQILSEDQPRRFIELFQEGIPVHVMDLDAEYDTVDALQVEVEENTQRRNYTAAEIREAAIKLEEAGYEKLRGRPAPGQKSLNRELMNVFRLSRRRISEILGEENKKSEHPCSLLDELNIYLKQAEKFNKRLRTIESDQEIQKIHRDLNKLIRTLKSTIKNRET